MKPICTVGDSDNHHSQTPTESHGFRVLRRCYNSLLWLTSVKLQHCVTNMVSTSISDFPYDVCEYISHHLSDADLSALRTFNRAFNDLTMLRSYRQITLRAHWTVLHRTGIGELTGFSLLSRPFSYHHLDDFLSGSSPIKRYVRSLQLVFAYDADGKDSRMRLKSRGGQPSEPGVSIRLNRITSLFSHFAQLEEFTVTVDRAPVGLKLPPQILTKDDEQLFRPVLRPLLPDGLLSLATVSNIRALTVCIPSKAWTFVFAPSLHLTRLEKLVIHFDRISHPGFDATSLNANILFPFVRRHSDTLRTLKLIRPYNAFYTRFPFLPVLTEIEIEEPYTRLPPTQAQLHEFLQRHSNTITRISWRSCGQSDQIGVGRTAWFDFRHHSSIPFPHLRDLELKNLNGLSEGLRPPVEEIGLLLGGYTGTLTRLCLGDYWLDSEPFNLILDAIASPILQVLEICPIHLQSGMFSSMAQKLPALQILRIVYDGLYPSALPIGYDNIYLLALRTAHDDLSPPALLFQQEMKSLHVSEWNIRELTLDTNNERTFSWDVNRAIARTFPSLFIINGIPVEEYFY
ncbi:hypothetical protein D9756_002303 [Leucocoprinus leucothites]|uniref:F-box domain-containing protein n=1 Tax=Leucocoprinus leucothites TaxID=201217 RepID=A0A8H5GBC9_9AGAR|nr:hypothetical protein D9756_002303 [Leucoagaricus leucothites]